MCTKGAITAAVELGNILLFVAIYLAKMAIIP